MRNAALAKCHLNLHLLGCCYTHTQQNTKFSRLNTALEFPFDICPQYSRAKKRRTLQKTGCYWAEEYNTSQLHRCSCVEVNKFLLAYVILWKHVYFRKYFACLRERIFNCCKRITVKLKLKFAIE